MNPGQARVIVLLIVLLVLEAQVNPDIKAYNAQVKKVAAGAAAGTPGSVPLPKFNIKYMMYWSVAALALIALAGPAPDIATVLVFILIFGVFAGHAKEFAAQIKKITGG